MFKSIISVCCLLIFVSCSSSSKNTSNHKEDIELELIKKTIDKLGDNSKKFSSIKTQQAMLGHMDWKIRN